MQQLCRTQRTGSEFLGGRNVVELQLSKSEASCKEKNASDMNVVTPIPLGKGPQVLSLWTNALHLTIQVKATFLWCRFVCSIKWFYFFEPVDKILKCDLSNESY